MNVFLFFCACSDLGRGSSSLYKHSVVFVGKEVLQTCKRPGTPRKKTCGEYVWEWHRLAHPGCYSKVHFARSTPTIKKFEFLGRWQTQITKQMSYVIEHRCNRGGLVSWSGLIHRTENRRMELVFVRSLADQFPILFQTNKVKWYLRSETNPPSRHQQNR